MNGDLLDAYQTSRHPVARVYEPQTVIAVLGAAGKPEEDLHLGALSADGIPHLRRRGGGGTVVLSPGQVVLALVTEVEHPFRNREYFGAINDWIILALSELGVRGVQPAGISDLAIGGKKILGSSIYRTRLVLFYQASILVSNDLSLFSRYLAMPKRVPEYRAGRDHESFCTTLVLEGYALGVPDVIEALDAVVATKLPALR